MNQFYTLLTFSRSKSALPRKIFMKFFVFMASIATLCMNVTMHGVVSYQLYENKDTSKPPLLIMGENHKLDDHVTFNSDHWRTFFDKIGGLSKGNYHTMSLYFNGNFDSWSNPRFAPAYPSIALCKKKIFELRNKQMQSPFQVKEGDLSSTESIHIEGISYLLENLLEELQRSNASTYHECPGVQHLAAGIQKTSKEHITKGQFFDSCESDLKKLQQWRDAFEPNSMSYILLDRKVSSYCEHLGKIKTVLSTSSTFIPLAQAFLGYISLHATTPTEASKVILSLTALLRNKSDELVMGSGLLRQIMTEKQPAIILAAQMLIADLDQDLKELGYQCVSQKQIIKITDPEEQKWEVDVAGEPNLHNGLKSTLEAFLANTKKPVEQIANSINESKKCAVCSKQGVKLMACGNCKNIFYCERACQIKDWASHKLVCKK